MTDNVRVRFAPSPTGHLHIGGARTAIYNWAFAKHHGGTFVLRIDDTDRERSTEENTREIMRSMRWLGLDWDEGPEVGGEYGPYYQMQRTDTYGEALEVLKANGHAYPCFCTAERLEELREAAREGTGQGGYDRKCRSIDPQAAEERIAAGEPHVWRVGVPLDRGDIVFDDAIKGETSFPGEAMDDFILVRTDGTPTYMFASVVDDWTMAITHIIRGDDHFSNTPRQIIVYEALEAEVPTFAHMSLIFGTDGKKISKRHGAVSLDDYRETGYLPDALLNYLAGLGFSIDGETTIFDRDTLVREFDLARVSRSPGIWDPEKLDWMNGLYLREMDPTEFFSAAMDWLEEAGLTTAEDLAARPEWYARLAPLVTERCKRLDEVAPKIAFLFADVAVEDAARDKVLAKEGSSAVLDAASEALATCEWSAEVLEAAVRAIPDALELKPKVVFQVLRVAVTGSMVSLPLFESLELLGRERTIERLAAARSLAAE